MLAILVYGTIVFLTKLIHYSFLYSRSMQLRSRNWSSRKCILLFKAKDFRKGSLHSFGVDKVNIAPYGKQRSMLRTK